MRKSRITSIGFSAGHLGGNLRRLAKFCNRLERVGAGHCELYAAELDVVIGGHVVPGRLRQLRDLCAAHHLAYTFHLPLVANLADASRSRRDCEVLGVFVELAGAIGADVLVLHPGRIASSAEPARQADMLALERESLGGLAAQAAAVRTHLSLENPPPDREVMAGHVLPHGLDPREVAAQVEQVAHPHLHGTLDLSHAWLSSAALGFDFTEATRAVAPSVGHLHIHDSCGLPPAGPAARPADDIAYGVYDLHLPVGWGTVPFEEIIPMLPVMAGTRVTIELPERFWDELENTFEQARALCELFPDLMPDQFSSSTKRTRSPAKHVVS